MQEEKINDKKKINENEFKFISFEIIKFCQQRIKKIINRKKYFSERKGDWICFNIDNLILVLE